MSFPQHPDEITVDWLTGILDAAPGDIESVAVRFVGDAIGNTSDVYFVTLTLRDGVDLPNALVAKMIPQFEGAIEVDKVLRLFEREIEVYRNVVSETPVRAPELIWSDYDPASSLGFLLMEDCSYCESFDQTKPVPSSIEDLYKIVEASARLHGRWWGIPTLPNGVLAVGDPTRSAFNSVVANGWQDLLAGGPGIETIPESGLPVAQMFADNFIELTENRWPTDHLTVMHLDFRVDNMFFDRANNEPVIFDWQGASSGRGAYDLAYLLSTGYSADFRRQHETDVLQHYHNELINQGVNDYSMDDLWRDYRFGIVFSLWVVPFTVILDLSSERGQALVKKVMGVFTAIDDHKSDVMLAEMFD